MYLDTKPFGICYLKEKHVTKRLYLKSDCEIHLRLRRWSWDLHHLMDTSLHIVNVLNLVIFYFFVGFNIYTVQHLKNTNSILFCVKSCVSVAESICAVPVLLDVYIRRTRIPPVGIHSCELYFKFISIGEVLIRNYHQLTFLSSILRCHP